MAMRLSQDEQNLIRSIRAVPAAKRPRVFGLVTTLVPIAASTGPRTFKTKAEIKAGNGFPCAASPSCNRTDIRTADRATRHATTQPELQQFGHSPDKMPLPKG